MALSKNVDQIITITGKISNIPWQHMIASVKDHPQIDYFDMDSGEQIVIYSKEKIRATGRIAITGTVISVQGGSKRPGAAKSDVYVEYHVVVNEWKAAIP